MTLADLYSAKAAADAQVTATAAAVAQAQSALTAAQAAAKAAQTAASSTDAAFDAACPEGQLLAVGDGSFVLKLNGQVQVFSSAAALSSITIPQAS